LSLGRVEGTSPDVFGSVSAVEIDGEGRLYVLDGQAQEVRVFGPDGTHLTTLGRPGEGPGEFRGAAGLNIDSEGNLWVWDPGNARFTAFTPDGSLIRSVPRRVGGVVFPWRGEIEEASGTMIDWGLDRPQAASSFNMGRLTVFYPIRVDLASGDLDTLAAFRYEASSDHEFRVPFRKSLTFSLASSGDVWLANTGQYRLHRVTLLGDTTLVVSRFGIEPMPVSPAERDSVLARPDPLGDMTGEHLDPDWIPTQKPVLSRMVTDGAGHLLVFPRSANHDAGTVVDVFRIESGEFLGQVDLPMRLEMNPPPVAGSGTLLGVTRSDLDVPVVVRIDLGPVTAGG
jgi:hypothetical protein